MRNPENDIHVEFEKVTQDRDEWKLACTDANQRFQMAEETLKVQTVRIRSTEAKLKYLEKRPLCPDCRDKVPEGLCPRCHGQQCKIEQTVDEFAVERAWKSLMKNHTLGQPISRRLVAEALKAALGKQKS